MIEERTANFCASENWKEEATLKGEPGFERADRQEEFLVDSDQDFLKESGLASGLGKRLIQRGNE